MRRMTLWLVVNGLMVLSLLIAACGPAATPTTPTATTTPTTPTAPISPTKPVQEKQPQQPTLIASAIRAAEKPKYGGTLTIVKGALTEKYDAGSSAG